MFRKRKHKESNENPFQDKVAGKIAGGLILLQTKLSDRMNKVKSLKGILIGFCIVSAALSIYFFVDAIFSKPKATFKIDQVRMPKHFDKSGDEIMENEMPDDIYFQIQDYKKHMDSLGLPIRQGLQDSMKILEEIYLQQHKK